MSVLTMLMDVQKMFEERTGYLPLSFMGHVDCFESWNDVIPPKVMPQLYGMLTHSMCPPTGYAAGFEGQFVVSKARILGHPLFLYRHLMVNQLAPALQFCSSALMLSSMIRCTFSPSHQ